VTDEPRGPRWRVLLAVVLGGLAVGVAAFVWAATGQSRLADRADRSDARVSQLEGALAQQGTYVDRLQAQLQRNGITPAKAPVITVTPGERGPAGQQGVVGPAGPQGAPGADGAPGPPGPQGDPGQPGAPGQQGDPGPAGRDGDAGPAGGDGKPGADGKDGRDGTTPTVVYCSPPTVPTEPWACTTAPAPPPPTP
jgi:hypothetical protein